jgi:hypothetical protein
MTFNRAWLLLAACLMTPITTASANVVTDWDEKAVAFIQRGWCRRWLIGQLLSCISRCSMH